MTHFIRVSKLLAGLLPATLLFSAAAHAEGGAPSAADSQGNSATISQSGGSGNRIHITQSGTANSATIRQDGENNSADIAQDGEENSINATQMGENNELTRQQNGNATATINQNGEESTHQSDHGQMGIHSQGE